MDDSTRLKWTRTIVFAGILLGYVSYPTYKLGLGEIYPFASWRLYSAPVGINEPASTYRVYWFDEQTETWRRQSFESTPILSRKEQGYVLNYWLRKVIEDPSNDEARRRLEVITKTIAPEAPAYRVVEESFYSLPLYADSSQYDTTTVVRFSR